MLVLSLKKTAVKHQGNLTTIRDFYQPQRTASCHHILLSGHQAVHLRSDWQGKEKLQREARYQASFPVWERHLELLEDPGAASSGLLVSSEEFWNK